MDRLLHYEDLTIGDRWTSRARTITESDVVGFAGLTGDYDPLHVDHEFAKRTPFGRPIVHGLLGLSFTAGLSSQCPAVNTLAFTAVREWKFLGPSFIGDTVHVVTEVVDKEANGRRSGRIIWRRQLVNQKGDVVQSGIFETLVAVREGRKKRKDSPDDEAAQKPHMLKQ